MRGFLIAGTALFALVAGHAIAADMPVRARAYEAPEGEPELTLAAIHGRVHTSALRSARNGRTRPGRRHRTRIFLARSSTHRRGAILIRRAVVSEGMLDIIGNLGSGC